MDRIKKLIARFNRDRLSTEEEIELEQMIEAGLVDLEDLAVYPKVMQNLHSEDNVKVSTDLDNHFYQILQQEKSAARISIFATKLFTSWRLPFSLGLASLAFILGMQFNTSSTSKTAMEPKAILAQMLSADDVNERIHIVSSASVDQSVDNQVAEALLFSLINDPSANVRLASIDALLNYAHLPPVRSGLIKAISHQSSPVVLTYLAEAIQISGQPLNMEEFKNLLDDDLPPPLLKSMVDVLPTL